jgi:SAM-dependent methyltransferase
MSFFSRLFSLIKFSPSSKTLAGQLRQPSGFLAKIVGQKMNAANASLYRFVLGKMNIRSGESILEIGFGNGQFFPDLFSKAADLKISGLDFSKKMVDAASQKNRQAIQAGRLKLEFGASDQMPFADNSFDHVFCINVAYFWEKPADHLAEILRVLRPGGKFYACLRDKSTMEKMPFTEFGFTKYEAGDWEGVLGKSGFGKIETHHFHETGIPGPDGQVVELDSFCSVATKN